MKRDLVFVSHCEHRGRIRIIGTRPQHGPSEGSMKKEPIAKRVDDMRKEYDLSKLTGGVRGKYYRRATAGTNLVLIEPDLVNMFPNSEEVNRVLRALAEVAQTASASKRRN